MEKLVIVESPAKAKTIGKILGAGFVVKSSMGHVRDLPLKTLGVDIHDSFRPRYVIVKGRRRVIEDLRKGAKKCFEIYLAPDPDREGEAIAWHLKEVLAEGGNRHKFLRVQYNEITPSVVRKAFESPGDIDQKRVDAQQARRVLDRIVGYTVSPLLWRRIQRGLSAGRVQSVALRLVCEREEEIRNFVSEEFWILDAMVRKRVAPRTPFRVRLVRVDGEKCELKTGEQADRLKGDLRGSVFRVRQVQTREVSRRPSPPHITSTLQQAGSTCFGFSPQRTMSIAQRLYEGVDLGSGPVGLITYMRTDSVQVSREAVEACRRFVTESLGREYCPEKPNVFQSRAGAQEAHEAIRPTDVTRTPETLANSLAPADLRVYTLIWQRFVASQMAPARIEQRSVEMEAPVSEKGKCRYLFRAAASRVLFPGYQRVSGSEAKKAEGDDVQELPDLAEGELLECVDTVSERKETQPPPRYSEASLVRTLEKNGVGRPSTYAQIISTLHQRNYVTLEKRLLVPTPVGMQVHRLLVTNLEELFNVRFTASMEESLDRIEQGKVQWSRMIEEFYGKFQEWMDRTKGPAGSPDVARKVLAALENVREWAPAVRSGRRVYNDLSFVESIRRQVETERKEISQRQLESLVRLACSYRNQVPAIEPIVTEAGYAHFMQETTQVKPSEVVLRKMTLLGGVSMDESARKFVASLKARLDGGRGLTEAQTRALNNVVLAHAGQIDGFESIRGELEIGPCEVGDDKESRPLISALAGVQQWQPPVRRGRKVYDDRAFYESLCRHFSQRGFLSVRQRAALKKMIRRYRSQVPNYDSLAREMGFAKAESPDAVIA